MMPAQLSALLFYLPAAAARSLPASYSISPVLTGTFRLSTLSSIKDRKFSYTSQHTLIFWILNFSIISLRWSKQRAVEIEVLFCFCSKFTGENCIK